MDNNNQNKKNKNKNEVERHATWLELFYDLVFVVTVSQLSHYFILVSLYTSLVVMDRYNILCY
jgi:low temperature requirement protein LtrA